MKVTYYLEVISSWCYWTEPAWAELKRRFEGRCAFDWKIAQMPPEAYPVSRSQCEWFYRRSGSVMRSPFMLNAGWFEPEIKGYVVPNLVTEAARQLGSTDDLVRLAIAHAAVREGRKVGRWDECVQVAAEAADLDPAQLKSLAQSPAIAEILAKTTNEFHDLQVTQRPTFLLTDDIGDRAVFSGLVRMEPVAAAIEAMLQDEAAYASWKAHFGDPPSA
jgi:predicted DsbA family dithiol-disulfide isomerase